MLVVSAGFFCNITFVRMANNSNILNLILNVVTSQSGSNKGGFNWKKLLILAAIAVVVYFVMEKSGVDLNSIQQLPMNEQTMEDVSGYGTGGNEEVGDVVMSESESDAGKEVESTKKKGVAVVQRPSKVGKNQIVKHRVFQLSYNDEHEQADWVFYLLTREMVNGSIGRTNDFRPDPDVKLRTAAMEDYTGSGYDRGHLCPSADVRIDVESQSETFYMSNVSPQVPDFDQGIWRKLEEQTRRWVNNHDSVWVATGPVLKSGLKKIGRWTKVSVPESYYKILYSPEDGGQMIGFMLPNDPCDGHTYKDYVVSVDEIETATGIDFFPGVGGESALESKKGAMSWWNRR